VYGSFCADFTTHMRHQICFNGTLVLRVSYQWRNGMSTLEMDRQKMGSRIVGGFYKARKKSH
jgi:hypothetical protein